MNLIKQKNLLRRVKSDVPVDEDGKGDKRYSRSSGRESQSNNRGLRRNRSRSRSRGIKLGSGQQEQEDGGDDNNYYYSYLTELRKGIIDQDYGVENNIRKSSHSRRSTGIGPASRHENSNYRNSERQPRKRHEQMMQLTNSDRQPRVRRHATRQRSDPNLKNQDETPKSILPSEYKYTKKDHLRSKSQEPLRRSESTGNPIRRSQSKQHLDVATSYDDNNTDFLDSENRMDAMNQNETTLSKSTHSKRGSLKVDHHQRIHSYSTRSGLRLEVDREEVTKLEKELTEAIKSINIDSENQLEQLQRVKTDKKMHRTRLKRSKSSKKDNGSKKSLIGEVISCEPRKKKSNIKTIKEKPEKTLKAASEKKKKKVQSICKNDDTLFSGNNKEIIGLFVNERSNIEPISIGDCREKIEKKIKKAQSDKVLNENVALVTAVAKGAERAVTEQTPVEDNRKVLVQPKYQKHRASTKQHKKKSPTRLNNNNNDFQDIGEEEGTNMSMIKLHSKTLTRNSKLQESFSIGHVKKTAPKTRKCLVLPLEEEIIPDLEEDTAANDTAADAFHHVRNAKKNLRKIPNTRTGLGGLKAVSRKGGELMEFIVRPNAGE